MHVIVLVPTPQENVERTHFFRVVAKNLRVHSKKDELEDVRLLYAPRDRILYQRLPVEVGAGEGILCSGKRGGICLKYSVCGTLGAVRCIVGFLRYGMGCRGVA